MPPQVALLLCTMFVAYLLWLDHRQSRKVSREIWIPALWMLYCASRPLGAWFGGGGGVEEGSSRDRWFQLILMLCSLAVLQRRQFDWGQFARTNRWLLALIALAAVSVVWSDESFISLKRWVRMSGSVLVAMVIASEPAAFQAMQAVIRRSVYILIPFSLLLIKYFQAYGVEFDRWSGKMMWAGVTTQKNGLGRLCMVSAFFLIWAFLKRRRLNEPTAGKGHLAAEFALLAMTLLLLKGPPQDYSATSTAVLIMGLVVFLTLRQRFINGVTGTAFLIPLLAAGLAAGLALPFFGGASAMSGATAMLGRDATFTGRTEIWSELVRVGSDSALLGVGYGGFWIHPPVRFEINESHNGYLEVWLELGLVGLVLLSIFLVSFWQKATRLMRTSFEWGAFSACLLLMTIIHNITESSFLRANSHLWTLLVFLLVGLLRQPSSVAQRQQSFASGRVARFGGPA